MSDLRKTYWQAFNAAGRVVGGLFVLVGTIFLLCGLSGGGFLFAVPGLVVGALGTLMICAKPSRPDITKDHDDV
jgi:hypothetical protein